MTCPRSVTLLAALALAAVSGGCDREVTVGSGYQLVADSLTRPVQALDVLFVVDNSRSMFDEESELADRFRAFLDTLDARMGHRPDLHIGVVSTDLGIGRYGMDNSPCYSTGDAGLLLAAPTSDACPTPDGNYIVDVAGPGGTRTTNYPDGQLAETFACIAHLPPGGCGMEQPLEAMRIALTTDDPTNAGFLRPDAMLLVVIVTDEDDCSAFDDTLFDPSQNTRDSVLGEYSSFRCFDFAVTCAEENRTVGDKTDCHVNPDSPYLYPVERYVETLDAVKNGPGLVVVTAMTGPAGPVRVVEDPGRHTLKPGDVCPDPETSAYPALRLHDWLDQMPRHVFSSICDPATAGDMTGMGSSAGAAMAAPQCLLRSPIDSDPDRPGVQPICRATVGDAGIPRPLPACADAPGQPCFEIDAQPDQCPDSADHLAVETRGLSAAVTHRVQVECLTAD